MLRTTHARIGRSNRGQGRTRAGRERGGFPRFATALVLVAVLLGIGALYLATGRGAGGAGAAPLSVLKTSDFHALAFAPDDPNVVFFGHHNGVMRSDDGGRTWRALVDRRNFDAMGLAVDPGNPRQVYVAGHDLFQMSADGGASWEPVPHDLPGTDVHGFAMSRNDPNRLYAFLNGVGGFASVDGGRTWNRLAGQLPGDVMGLAAAGGDPETLYATSMSSGLLRSADGGRSWARSENGLGSSSVFAVAIDPSAPQTVYAGAEGGIWKSTDSGSSWSKLPFQGSNAVALALSPARTSVLVAIAQEGREGRVYRSEDGGLTWAGG